MEMPELANNPEFKTNSDRVKNREKLLAKFAEKLAKKDSKIFYFLKIFIVRYWTLEKKITK